MKPTVIIIEDDLDDYDVLKEALRAEKEAVEIAHFKNPLPALEYLQTAGSKPYLIVSDINMPKMDGIAFKRKINEDLRLKDIPFVFLTTAQPPKDKVAELSVQGYFVKPNSLKDFESIAKSITCYWKYNMLNF